MTRHAALGTALLFFLAPQGAQTQAPQAPGKSVPLDSRCALEAETRGVKLPFGGVKNFGCVSPHFYRGGQPTEKGVENLRASGIAAVVNLRDDPQPEEERWVHRAGMEYFPIRTNCHAPRDADVAKFLEFLRSHANKKIFVHCHYGVDRTGLMIAAYRMTEQHWTAEKAREEMTYFGFSLKHRFWCRGTEEYEKNFRQEFSSSPAFQSLRGMGAPAPH